MGKFLSEEDRTELKELHRFEHERRYADRIKSLLLWDSGWTLEQISEVLLLDEKTVRRYRKLYEADGPDRLLNDDWKGSKRRLTENQEKQLREHLSDVVYSSTKEIAQYVKKTFGVEYSSRGMQEVIVRLGFVYKKTKAIPGKADAEAQREFLESYQNLKVEKSENDPVYFIDGVHPQHNSNASYGWILKGKEKQIPSNTGRRRLNIVGALNAETHAVVVKDGPTVNAQLTISLLKTLEKKHPESENIYIVLDNARYHRSSLLKEFVADSRIVLLFLPPYAPNLNLIERLWKFFKKRILSNRYYESFLDFRKVSLTFFRKIAKYKSELETLLTENFQILELTA
jgi:transposase